MPKNDKLVSKIVPNSYQNRTNRYDFGTIGTIFLRKIVPKKNNYAICVVSLS